MATAEALLAKDFQGHQTRELLGQRDLDFKEITAIIGKAIGKPTWSMSNYPMSSFGRRSSRWEFRMT